jgi:ADP-ribosylation factor related protein 1
VLQFWDLGGQKDFRTVWPKYYQDCHAMAFIVDSTDEDRFKEVWEVFGPLPSPGSATLIARPDTIIKDSRLENIPVLILANKQDDPKATQVEVIKNEFSKVIANSTISESSVMPVSALQGWAVSM